MPIDEAAIADYERDGLLQLGRLLDDAELDLLRREAYRLGSTDRALAAANLRDEASGVVWRSYAPEIDSAAFRALVRLPRIVDAVRALLGPDVYLWRAHMNHKVPRLGEAWHWHRDYDNWRLDGLPRGGPRDCLTAMVLLDDATPDNGPLQIIRGSHRIDPDHGYWDTTGGKLALQAVSETELADLLAGDDTVEVLGEAGSVVLFSGLAVHGSRENRSERPRCIAYLAYARADNRAGSGGSRRPHVSPYQLSHDTTALDPTTGDDALRSLATGAG